MQGRELVKNHPAGGDHQACNLHHSGMVKVSTTDPRPQALLWLDLTFLNVVNAA
jgi:hypothetical protein